MDVYNETCHNENECDLNLHYCSLNAHCLDSDGSFSCQCKKGYQDVSIYPDVGLSCIDVDECQYTGTVICQNNTLLAAVSYLKFRVI